MEIRDCLVDPTIHEEIEDFGSHKMNLLNAGEKERAIVLGKEVPQNGGDLFDPAEAKGTAMELCLSSKFQAFSMHLPTKFLNVCIAHQGATPKIRLS